MAVTNLGVSMTRDAPLITAWYRNVDTLPLLHLLNKFVIPLAGVLKLLKSTLVSLPGMFRRDPGAIPGAVALLFIPCGLYCTTQADRILAPTLKGVAVSGLALENVINFQLMILLCSFCMLVFGIAEYMSLAGAEENIKLKEKKKE
eukprot:CAMPEP_0114239078 /NCGR_PEP_ID=MMETSP0058-20121206/8259_1 /TAXON_ID=36894 /ORGANISM="Pyramimonas parkeae, CCMP726" /LENGTH=145 /DNA_ID=CAMNT_0001351217 /DNA_START=141 /DNA_END=578 /DNA_ORIENTATION=+